VAGQPLHFFAPRPAWRFRTVEWPFAAWYDPVAGSNPPYGASLSFWLKTEPKDSVAFRVSDATGRVVRSFKAAGKPGLNRVWWDLRYDLSREAKLRTPPRHAPEVPVPAEGRNAPDGARIGILAPPGSYTITLEAAGQQATRQLELRKDPGSGGSEEEIRTQVALLGEIRADLDTVVGMVNRIEGIRSQLVALRNTLAADTAMAGVRARADSLEEQLLAVEGELTQLKLTGRGQDDVRYPMKLMMRLGWLADGIAGSDFAPTTQQRDVQQLLRAEVRAARTRFGELLRQEVAGFNELLRTRNVAHIVVIQE
jgi:hypothetical protein